MLEQRNFVIYWSTFVHEGGSILAAATTVGLCYVGTQAASFEQLTAWAHRWARDSKLQEDEQRLVPYIIQVTEFLQGKRTEFTLPLDLRGTDFQLTVWRVLRQIAYGEKRTYTDIALQLQRPNSVRAVASAIGANPVLLAIPCHRVVGKDGSLTGFRDGLKLKAELLEMEGSNSNSPLSL